MSKGPKVGIIGGGVIGLASAWHLQQAGCEVTLFDANRASREASWAAAGMLAPHHEAQTPDTMWELGLASLKRWPRFAAALDPDNSRIAFRQSHGWIPSLDEGDEALIEAKAAWLLEQGVNCRDYAEGALHRQEPHLAADIRRALAVPAASVNPRRLSDVLKAAGAKQGVDLRFGYRVTGIDAGRIELDNDETWSGDEVLIASGAWTPTLAYMAGIEMPGEPVKGQMLRFAVPDGTLNEFVHHPHGYCLPRPGQGVVVGSTVTRTGFDKSEDQTAIDRLAAQARRLLPDLAQAPIAETWTGLRPRLASGRPLLARIRPGLSIASGHYRNGILLTPITAEIMTALILDRDPGLDLGPYSLDQATTPSDG